MFVSQNVQQFIKNCKQMASLKIVFDNQMHIQKLPNPQQITYEFLQEIVAKVFAKLPKKYTMYYQSNRTLTQINNRVDILNWVTKRKINNQIQQIKNETSILEMHVLQAAETNISNNINQYEKMIVDQFSKTKIQNENKSQNKQLPLDQLVKKMDKMKIIQDTQSEEQQSQQEQQKIAVKRQHLQVKLEQKLLDQDRQHLKTKWAKHQVKKQDLPVHKDVLCCSCLQINIVGVRWKCTICRDFDLCEKCEQSEDHQHDLIKIKKPEKKTVKQAPVFSEVRKEDYIEVEFPWKSKHKTREQKKAMWDQKQEKIMGNQILWNQIVSKALELSQLLDIPYQQCLDFSRQHYEFEFQDLVQIYYQKKNKSIHHQ